MHCSRCSEPIRPVVAVDIDGTLGDYHGHFLVFANSYLDKTIIGNPINYDGRDSFKEWFCLKYGVTERDWHDVKLAYRQGGMKRSMPIFDGARALCWSARDAGAELWVTTTRPYLSLDNIVPDTVEWLRRNEIEYDGMLFDEDKYQQLAERVDPGRVVAVVDDLPEQLRAAAAALNPAAPLLVRGDYNRGATYYGISTTLEAACDIVLDRIATWKEEYGCAA